MAYIVDVARLKRIKGHIEIYISTEMASKIKTPHGTKLKLYYNPETDEIILKKIEEQP